MLLISTGLVAGIFISRDSKKPEPQTSLIPTSINEKVSFPSYVPSNDAHWVLDSSKTSFDQESGVLSLTFTQGSRSIVLTQQASPQVFSDVPQQYTKMLSSMNQYAELQTAFGAVAITHPKELNGGQAAVINKSGTLIFAKPNQELSDEEWKVFFNNLRLNK